MPSCSIMFRWSSAAVQVVVSTGVWARRPAARKPAERSAVRFMNDKRTYLVRERNKWGKLELNRITQVSRVSVIEHHRLSPAHHYLHRLVAETHPTSRLGVAPAEPSTTSNDTTVWSKRMKVELVPPDSETTCLNSSHIPLSRMPSSA